MFLSEQEYFLKRPAPDVTDYEESYWGTVTDPDGKVRDRLQERQQFLDDTKQEIAFLVSLSPGRILDIGCGLGFLLSAMPEAWKKYGVEVSRFAVGYASEWAKVHIGDTCDARFPDAFFDVVVMHHVIEHVEDPIALILEVRRILKSGGVLLLGTPDFDSACARRFKENYRLLHDRSHISLFSCDSMHRFLRDHGFAIDRVEFPFFETRHFTRENLERLFDTSKISPPFHGNYMTFYCHAAPRPRRAVMSHG